ncbi:hypothetical protein B0H17DRAFT_429947 [Mycena rosella]|uniref:Transmembrane protein n=1 Tax=Mycena rosella TaxID=1033263 RepID=A0AAD7CH93_MYCRO|nr:hypothetical protein B0H17DRAFT_429947 [Mycena rosella]
MSTSLNITVPDQSPTWLYSPDREGVSSSSWQSVWSGSPDSSYDATHNASNIAQGTSSHITTFPSASAQIDFVGSAVSIYGQGTAGAYSTTLDGGNAVAGSPTGSVLASYSGLGDGKHTIILKVTQPQQLTLSYATVTIRSAVQTSSVQNTTEIAVTSGANNVLATNPFFSTSGSGSFSNLHQDQNYTRLDTNTVSATISFTCSNASAIFIYGTTNWNHQTYSVELDPSVGASQGARVFNGTSKWFVLNNLIFFEGAMDPTRTYQVKMTNLVGNSYSDLHSVVMMNLPASSSDSVSSSSGSGPSPSNNPGVTSSPKSGVGKTVAIAVSVVVALAAIILFAFLFCRRRAQKRRNNSKMSLNALLATPFTADTPPPSMSDGPMSLGHMRNKSSIQDPYSDSQPPYSSTNSAVASVQNLRENVFGSHGTRYSEVSNDDSNPYSTTAYATGSGSVLSSALASTSAPQPGPTGHPYNRRPEKGPIPSEASLNRPIRQEVDAGRVPTPAHEEETLPPNYDPNWAN